MPTDLPADMPPAPALLGPRMLTLLGAALLTAGLGWGAAALHASGPAPGAVAEAEELMAAPRAGAGYLDGRPVPLDDRTAGAWGPGRGAARL